MENEETTPQFGRARDIYIAELVAIYLADVERVARKKKEYNTCHIDELRRLLGFPKYRNIPLRQALYNEVIETSYDDLVNAIAEGDVPTKEQQEELIRQTGLDPKLIEKLYLQCVNNG